MTGFSADWLTLREPYDQRARNKTVLDAVIAEMAGRHACTIVDIACGTGSTFRAISPRIACRQNWRLADNDLGLLARAAELKTSHANVSVIPLDLTRDLEAVLDGAVDLITTSALFDLVSLEWLDRFTTEVAVRNLPVYVALTFDGRMILEPSDPLDSVIAGMVNLHQLGDKGFGPALGPKAAAAAIEQFKAKNYQAIEGRADWEFGPADCDIQLEVINGWAGVARDIGDLSLAEVIGWVTRRHGLLAAGRSSIRIGHVDFFAVPIGTRRAERSQSNNISSSSG